jgi:hypothetical protein
MTSWLTAHGFREFAQGDLRRQVGATAQTV